MKRLLRQVRWQRFKARQRQSRPHPKSGFALSNFFYRREAIGYRLDLEISRASVRQPIRM